MMPSKTPQASFTQTNFAQQYIFDIAREISKIRQMHVLEKEPIYLDVFFQKVVEIYYTFNFFTKSLEEKYKKLYEKIDRINNGGYIWESSADSKDLRDIDKSINEFYKEIMMKLGMGGFISPYIKTIDAPAHMQEG